MNVAETFIVKITKEYSISVEADTRTEAYAVAEAMDTLGQITPHATSMQAYKNGEDGGCYIYHYPSGEAEQAARERLAQYRKDKAQ
jgi:hypothetical protein